MTERQVFYELGSETAVNHWIIPVPLSGLPQRSDTAPKPLMHIETKLIPSRTQLFKLPYHFLTTSSSAASVFVFPAVYIYLFPKSQ